MKLKKPEIRPQQDGDGKVKRMFRRNQVIITTLAIMIAAAGYLNYAGKKELEAGSKNHIYQAGSMDISDEEIFMENQLAGDNTQPQAEGSLLQAEAQTGTEQITSEQKIGRAHV